MRAPQLSSVDLNLLPALGALLQERSVTRAALLVGLSQSAMSRALARLRRALDDELLVRERGGYRLTPTAEQLLVQVEEVLPRLHEMFLNRAYTPASAGREFRMAGSDYALAALGPKPFAAVLAAAPRSSVRFLPWHDRIVDELVNSRIDLLFHGVQLTRPIISTLLFTDETVCLVHREHPAAGRTSLTMHQYLACRHLVIDIVEGTQPSIDAILAAHGHTRRAALTLPYQVGAAAVLAGTDLVLSLPSRLARHVGQSPDLRILRAPVEIRPVPYYVSWHSRQQHNRGHQWLRETVLAAIC